MKSIKSISTYTISSALTAGIPFLVLPILTQYLSPEDYGVLRLFSASVLILMPFIGLTVQGLTSIEYFKVSSSEFASLFSSGLRIPVLNTLIYSALVLLFKEPLSVFLEIPESWLLFIPVLGFATIVTDHCTSMMIQQKRPLPVLKFSVSRTIIETSLTLFLVVQLGMNWEGRIFSWLITISLFTLVALYYFKRQGWLSGEYSPSWIKQSLVFGVPLIPHAISKFVINQSDIFFISKMVSLEATGLYGVGYQFGLVLAIISGAFLSFLSPYMNERLANIDTTKKIEIVKMCYIYLFTLVIGLVIITFSSEVIFTYFLNERFIAGAQYVFWIALAYLFWGAYSVFAKFIFFHKRTTILTYLAVLNIVLNIGLNFALIPIFGALGAAYATAISFAVVLIGVMISSWRVYPMPWFYFIRNQD